MFYLRITHVDHDKNMFLTCGGAGFNGKYELEEQWRSIPESDLGSDDPARLILDKLDSGYTILDEKFITREIAEELLGKSYKKMIAEAVV